MMTAGYEPSGVKPDLMNAPKGGGLAQALAANRPPKIAPVASHMALSLHREQALERPGKPAFAALLSSIGVRGSLAASRIAQLNRGPGVRDGR